MKAVYLTLNELKRTDEKLFRLRNELDKVPVELAELDAQIAKSLETFQQVKNRFEILEKEARKAEGELKEKEDYLRKAESKMMEVKTNVEYQAAQRENETHLVAKGQLEEKVLGLLSEVDQFKTQVKEADSLHKKRAEELNQTKSRLQDEQKSIQKSFDELLDKRKGVVSQLDGDIQALYEKSRTAVKGVPIALVESGLCSGCHVKVRPQLFNEVLGFKAVHRCPSCNRILVVPVDETEAVVSE